MAARTNEGPRLETEGQDDLLTRMIAPLDVERYLRFRRHWELKRLRRLPMPLRPQLLLRRAAIGMKYDVNGAEIPETAEELEALERELAPASELGDVAELLDDVRAHINRFIGFGSNHAAIAITLWVAHCYVVEAAPMAAYLRVRSAAEESGKSTLLEVLHQLLRARGINAVSVSPSVVYRLREKVGPVALLLDESDNGLSKRQDDSARDLLAIVNAGYRRSAMVYRTEGRSFEPRGFKAFGPAAIAGIGYLEPTTESRCIPIILPRKQRGSLERFLSFKVEPVANRLADRLDAWATPEVQDVLRDASPAFPRELRDRHVEVWWNLFAIADLAGEGWPEAARAAALALHVGDDDESSYSVGVLLLAHIAGAFEEAETDRLPTAKLLDLLASNEEGPGASGGAPS